MGDSPLISVIVPVYNVELYLRECVDSILRQSFKDLELILVDDGSRDASGKICDEYAEKDSRVRVIHQENGGAAAARNAGLTACSGEYINFVDSDDWWIDDCLGGISAIIKNVQPDALVGKIFVYRSDESRRYEPEIYYLDMPKSLPSPEEYFRYLATGYHCSPCRFFVRRSVLIENGLFFENGLKREDEGWAPLMLVNINSFSFYQKPHYVYRINRPGSSSLYKGKDMVLSLLRISNILEQYGEKTELPEYKCEFLNIRASKLTINALVEYAFLKRDKEIEKQLYMCRKKFLLIPNFKNIILFLTILILGVYPASQIFKLYYNARLRRKHVI